jgi:hypothetical protein
MNSYLLFFGLTSHEDSRKELVYHRRPKVETTTRFQANVFIRNLSFVLRCSSDAKPAYFSPRRAVCTKFVLRTYNIK